MRAEIMKKVILLFALFLFIISGHSDISYAKKAKQPAVDKDEIKRLAERDFDSIINLWKDEKYDDLYGYGLLSSHIRVSKEAFSKKMREKKWKLMCCGDAAREIEAVYKSQSVVYVKALMGYKSAINTKEIKQHATFRLAIEDGKWKIDLLQLLRAPDIRR